MDYTGANICKIYGNYNSSYGRCVLNETNKRVELDLFHRPFIWDGGYVAETDLGNTLITDKVYEKYTNYNGVNYPCMMYRVWMTNYARRSNGNIDFDIKIRMEVMVKGTDSHYGYNDVWMALSFDGGSRAGEAVGKNGNGYPGTYWEKTWQIRDFTDSPYNGHSGYLNVQITVDSSHTQPNFYLTGRVGITSLPIPTLTQKSPFINYTNSDMVTGWKFNPFEASKYFIRSGTIKFNVNSTSVRVLHHLMVYIRRERVGAANEDWWIGKFTDINNITIDENSGDYWNSARKPLKNLLPGDTLVCVVYGTYCEAATDYLSHWDPTYRYLTVCGGVAVKTSVSSGPTTKQVKVKTEGDSIVFAKAVVVKNGSNSLKIN